MKHSRLRLVAAGAASVVAVFGACADTTEIRSESGAGGTAGRGAAGVDGNHSGGSGGTSPAGGGGATGGVSAVGGAAPIGGASGGWISSGGASGAGGTPLSGGTGGSGTSGSAGNGLSGMAGGPLGGNSGAGASPGSGGKAGASGGTAGIGGAAGTAGAAVSAGGGAGAGGVAGATQKTVTFSPFVFSPTPMSLGQAGSQGQGPIYYSDSVVLDLDQDGKLDWAGITDPHTTQILPCSLAAMQGHGDGTFGPDLLFVVHAGGACNGIFAADLLGNGKPAVVFAGGGTGATHVVTTKDGKTFSETQTLAPSCLWAADLTGDGRDELVCPDSTNGQYNNALVMALNNGNGVLSVGGDIVLPDGFLFGSHAFTRAAPPPSPQALILSDGASVVAPVIGKASNGVLKISASRSPPNIVAAADLYAVGHSQLIDASGTIWETANLATFTTVGSIGSPGLDSTLEFADVDGDGRMDVLVSETGAMSTKIYRQNPDKTFAQVWSGSGYLRFADVNGDGLPDLVDRMNIRAALNTTK